MPEEKVYMKGYKGFEKGLICRGKQYAENTVYEEDKAEICENGMHFCENPFEVWRYYPPCNDKGEFNEFAEVEALSDPQTDDNSKFCTTKLQVGAKIRFTDFVKAGAKFILEKTKDNAATNTGYCSAATNTGDCSAATNTGDYSAATNTGDYSAAMNTGYCSAATVERKNSIAIATGYQGKAKGSKGSWIVCTERDNDNNILCVKAAQVDGEKIKENTFYTLKNGEFVESEDKK